MTGELDEDDEANSSAEREYWAFVIARGLKSVEEGRASVWDDETDRRIRERIFRDR